jgi:hypothetical protein
MVILNKIVKNLNDFKIRQRFKKIVAQAFKKPVYSSTKTGSFFNKNHLIRLI